MTIDVQAQTSVQPIHSESTDKLFANDAPVDDPRGDGEIAPVVDSIGHQDAVHLVVDENTPVQL